MDFIFLLIPTVAIACYCVLLLILFNYRKDKIIRIFISFVLVNIVWCAASLMMRLQVAPGMLFYNRILVSGMILAPLVLLYFTRNYVKQGSKMPLIPLLFAIVLLVLDFLGLVVKNAYYDANQRFQYELGFAAVFVSLYGFIVLFLAIVNLVKQVRQGKRNVHSVLWIIIGTALLFFGCACNLLPTIGQYPIDIAMSTVNAIMIAYSVLNYRFLDVRIMIKKGVDYSAVTIIMTTVSVVMVYSMEYYLRKAMGYQLLFLSVLLAFVIVLFLQPVRDYLQILVDKVYYKKDYTQRNAAKTFRNNIGNYLMLDELCDALLNAIQNGITCKSSSLALNNPQTGDFKMDYSSTKDPRIGTVLFRAGHPLITWFNNDSNKHLFIEDIENEAYFKSLWASDKELLRSLGADLFVPIRIRGQLIGILILSRKVRERNYSEEDLDILDVLLSSTAIMIENARMYEHAKLEAITDGLTKLYNHRYFSNMLNQFVSQSKNKFALMIFDLDHFKLYNDLHGHYEGDRVLEQTADIIRNQVGEKGLCFRYGGEEFTILMPDISGEEAMEYAERIRTDIEKLAVNKEDKKRTFLTISAGLSAFPDNGSTCDQLLKCADLALYTAKRDGKNKCVLYGMQQTNGIQTEMDSDLNQEQMNFNYSSPVYALAATIEAKDQYTFSHSQNVSRFGAALARVVGLDSNHVEIVRQAGLLHDIGKIGIPETILLKDSPLDAAEYEIIKGHVEITISIIKHIPSLNRLVPCVLYHHERWDGKGYPRGIAGDAIPIEARCLTIADSFDAMTNDRPYRKAMSTSDALAEIEKGKDTQFDPVLAQMFINHIKNAVSKRSEGKRLLDLLN